MVVKSTVSASAAYNPLADTAERFPTWHIGQADLGGRASEVVCSEQEMILIDPSQFGGDLELAYAHVVSHLDHHMRVINALTDVHESEADWIAAVRLDREDSRV